MKVWLRPWADEAENDDELVLDGDELVFEDFVGDEKLFNQKNALRTWEEHEGDSADGCNSGVATKREGFPSQTRATQEADHPEAALKDTVDICEKPRLLDEAIDLRLSQLKNMRRKVERMIV